MSNSDRSNDVSSSGDTFTFDEARMQLSRMHVVAETPLQRVFHNVAKLVSRALNVDRLGVWLLLDDQSAIRCHHLYHSSREEVYEGAVLHARDFPGYFKAIQTQRIITINDAQHDPLSEELRESYLEPLGITSLLDAPLYRGGKVVGVVCCEHTGPVRTWTRPEQDFAISVADIVSRLFEEAARHQAELSLDAYQAHLMEMHRMEALGRLASGIAHDFRNVLTVVLAQGCYIKETPNLNPVVSEAADDIIDAAERGNKMIHELLAFGKGTPDSPHVLDAKHMLDSLTGMLQLAAGRAVRLCVQCAAGVSLVFIDPSQFERAILNLVLNGRDAMLPRGGDLLVELTEKTLNDNRGADSTYVCITVKDFGVGMDEETRKRIFEPFFTTKGDKGTGLGLAIVHQIIHRAGGFLRIESEVGKGSAIDVFLPRIGRMA
jgi:two-component system, cell cycle sensor histidine kinase and response regulator CckA